MKYIISLILGCTLTFIYPNENTSSTNRYIKFPIDFNQSVYGITYGFNDWEISFSGKLQFVLVQDDLRSSLRTESYGNYTYTDEAWVSSDQLVEFSQEYIKSIDYDKPYYNLNLGITKFFNRSNNEEIHTGAFYLYSGLYIHRISSTQDYRIKRNMTETYIDPPNDPTEGDVYGVFWEEGPQTISLEKRRSIDSGKGLNLSFGYDYHNTKPLFNTSNLFFGITLTLVDLDFDYRKRTEHRTDEDIDPTGAYDFDTSEFVFDEYSMRFNNPSITISFRYSL